MILNGENRQRLVAHALDRAVVQVQVRDLYFRRERSRDDGVVVVLRSDFDFSRRQILHGMIAAVMPEAQALRASQEGEMPNSFPLYLPYNRDLY